MKLPLWIAAALLAAFATPAAAQPRDIGRPGTVAHRAAGAHFPERIGELERQSVVQYDEAGTDISAMYELHRGGDHLRLSVYVYPAAVAGADAARANLCRTELDMVGQIIENQPQYRGARRIEDGAAPAVEGVDRALSLRTVHSFTSAFFGPEQELRSLTDLYCYVGGRWQVKYRATFTPGFDATEAIEQVIRSGPWPGRNPPPAPDEAI
jgi:hypothetical protein